MAEIVIDASLVAAFALLGEKMHRKVRALIATLATQDGQLIAMPIFETRSRWHYPAKHLHGSTRRKCGRGGAGRHRRAASQDHLRTCYLSASV